MSDDAKEHEAEPHQLDESATAQAVACLVQAAMQLREIADYLQELAQQPIEDSRTLH